MQQSITVVVAVYNSENSIDQLHKVLTKELNKFCSHYEIIMVDDGSVDNSYREMKRLHNIDSRVKVIQLDGNFGQQNALMCGFHYSTGEYVVTIDDDLQHPPEEIYKLKKKIDEGYDVVYAIPIIKKHSGYRKIGSKMTDYMFNKICSKPKNIKVSSFRIIRKNIVKEIIKDNTSFVYISAITFKNTRSISNVEVKHDLRKYGKSNYNFYKLFKLYIKLYLYYSNHKIFKKFISSKQQFKIKDKKL
ncbi:glycosyltransferase family 2 protein [Clostridium sp.]|uniref:glycosyltransferase family 2 protein n=1 Tax=Clostridium sp. TaxID=1506 RepID=UPI001A64299F|nr:glycosyltransferase family 2 protein [Clostridium sp.]MBK5234485.1 glycosyltransferase family 2 protein [Clostridium sp.]